MGHSWLQRCYLLCTPIAFACVYLTYPCLKLKIIFHDPEQVGETYKAAIRGRELIGSSHPYEGGKVERCLVILGLLDLENP